MLNSAFYLLTYNTNIKTKYEKLYFEDLLRKD